MILNPLRLILLALLLPIELIAQCEFDDDYFQRLLEDEEYALLLDELTSLYVNDEYCEEWRVATYLALTYCANNQYSEGQSIWSYLLSDHFNLSREQKEFVREQKERCVRPELNFNTRFSSLFASIFASFNTIPESVNAGKFGRVLKCTEHSRPFDFVDSFDQSEIQKRLFKLDQAVDAIRYYEDFLPEGEYNINASGRFVLITPSSKMVLQSQIDAAAERLERVYNYYYNVFNVRAPDKLITVYFMEDRQKLRKAALDTHGLKLSEDNIGYSNLGDLSILGNSRKDAIGTLKHELFHLMIRTDVGDIPGWLDEGIASYFAESHWQGDSLVTDSYSWRTQTLKDANKRFERIPTLRELIEGNWTMFRAGDNMDVCDLSVNYAIAEHFAYFLNAKGKMFDIVELFKNRRTPIHNKYYEFEQDVAIVEMLFDMPLGLIQKDFNTWMESKYGITVYWTPENIEQKIYSLFDQLDESHTCRRSNLEMIKSEISHLHGEWKESYYRLIHKNFLLEPMVTLDVSESFHRRSPIYWPTLNNYFDDLGLVNSYRLVEEHLEIFDDEYWKIYVLDRDEMLDWLEHQYKIGFGCRGFRVR